MARPSTSTSSKHDHATQDCGKKVSHAAADPCSDTASVADNESHSQLKDALTAGQRDSQVLKHLSLPAASDETALDFDVGPADLINEILGLEPHLKALIDTAEPDGEELSKQDLLDLVLAGCPSDNDRCKAACYLATL